MKAFLSFTKKEFLEQLRSGKIVFLGSLFVLLGIMNPAVAKLTPWLLEMLADSLAESGMTVTQTTVTAMDSWVQFFKNMPLGLIAFVLIESSIFTKEYASGTLVLSLTKGLPRFKVILSKATVMTLLWTVGYWLCVAITYGYNAYFWDNSIADNLILSLVCWWIFGVFVISLTVLFSTLSTANTGVLVGVGGVVLISYLIGLLPKLEKYLPTRLTDGSSLIYGVAEASEYTVAIVITAVATLVCFVVSIPIFQKKQL